MSEKVDGTIVVTDSSGRKHNFGNLTTDLTLDINGDYVQILIKKEALKSVLRACFYKPISVIHQ